MKLKVLIAGALLMLAGYSVAGQTVVESVVAVVGNEVIYLSDIEGQVLQRKADKDPTPIETMRCQVFEDQLIQKLFLDQARIDSIKVTPETVETDLNARLTDFIRRAGSEQALETYFNKSMTEIRQDLREMLTNQQIIQEMQGKIVQTMVITPEEVKDYYNKIPKDSLPLVPRKVELSVIQVEPPSMEENKAEVRQKLLDLRSRIIKGESFSTLAVLYSEDQGTAPYGGELGFKMRGELVKPYADAAFSLKKNVVSKIVESEFGFHIIQLIERKGEMVNTRHILMKPKLTADQTEWSILRLDSIADLVRKDSLTFPQAAMRFSTDITTRVNGGKMVYENPNDRVTWFSLDQLSKEMNMVVRDLKVGEISEPFRTTDSKGNSVYCILRLDSEIPPHRANMKEDYQFIADAALSQKKMNGYQDWINKKIKKTYIKISDEYRDCSFYNKGWLQ
jgi:peptidyl-prolyl cis-trans isomerase SurA